MLRRAVIGGDLHQRQRAARDDARPRQGKPTRRKSAPGFAPKVRAASSAQEDWLANASARRDRRGIKPDRVDEGRAPKPRTGNGIGPPAQVSPL